jgi:hypothetical protein
MLKSVNMIIRILLLLIKTYLNLILKLTKFCRMSHLFKIKIIYLKMTKMIVSRISVNTLDKTLKIFYITIITIIAIIIII